MCSPTTSAFLMRFAFQNVHRRHGSFNAHRIAAESGGMRAGDPVHELGARQHHAQRHAGGNALGDGDDVRLNAGVLDGPPFSAASRAALDFIGDQQNAVLIADAAQFAHELGGRRHVAAFALDRFNEDGGALLPAAEWS